MDLPAPKNWVVYIGADGSDAIPDAAGYLWWADNIYVSGRKDETFRAAVMRTRNNVTEIIELPELLEGAITLSWSPAGLHAAGSKAGVTKVFRVSQFAQFNFGVPVIVHYAEPTVSGIDTTARAAAAVAAQEARRATETVNALKSTVTTLSQRISSLSASLPQMIADISWTKVNDRLGILIESFARNNRSDPLNSRWHDVLFQKTKDWIYIWMRENKKL